MLCCTLWVGCSRRGCRSGPSIDIRWSRCQRQGQSGSNRCRYRRCKDKPEADYCGVGIGTRFRLRDFKVFRLPCEAGLGDCTAEARPSTGSGHGEPVEPRRARRKAFLIEKYSELCELCVSVVNASSEETQNGQNLRRRQADYESIERQRLWIILNRKR